jgi:hypothetical protein
MESEVIRVHPWFPSSRRRVRFIKLRVGFSPLSTKATPHPGLGQARMIDTDAQIYLRSSADIRFHLRFLFLLCVSVSLR